MAAHRAPPSAENGIPPRLVLFPGLGADARLFEAQRKVMPFLEVPQWLPPRPLETLESYARRTAERVGHPGEALYLGGASFGGAVALEVARHLRPRAVFLIGSLRTPCGVPRLYNWLGRGAARCPRRMVESLVRMAPLAAGLFGATTKKQRQAFVEQLCATPPEFLHWGLRAVLDWRPKPEEGIPVFQIHGERDRILPCRLSGADAVVPGAGHLVNVTHADAVNEFILARLAETGAAMTGGRVACP